MFQRAMPFLFCGFLAACGDPLAGLDRLNEVDLPQQDASAAVLPTQEEVAREGFFGTPAATGGAPAADVRPVVDKAAPRGGFFGRLLERAPARVDTSAAQAPRVSTDPADPETVDLASLTPVPDAAPEPARRGLFRRAAPQSNAATPRSGPDARDITHGSILPFGEVARTCDTQKNQLGRKVENAPAQGYALYDSVPNSADPRTFYLTGFSDGCPRQFTAANVLLGSAGLYERLHFGPGGEFLPEGATDAAYEKVKRRVCGTGRRKPCGSKIKQMERSTFFVTAYDRFGDANNWSELLIHDGQVLAAAIKSNN